MEIDFNFIKLDLENSMALDAPPSKPFDAQRELRERARAMHADVGKVSTDGGIFDRELKKLLSDTLPASPISKAPARVAQGHTWPDGYQPTEELLGQPPLLSRASSNASRLRAIF